MTFYVLLAASLVCILVPAFWQGRHPRYRRGEPQFRMRLFMLGLAAFGASLAILNLVLFLLVQR
ncbi:hypothetical protein [Herbiconiux sp. A18JL235]|uniref:Uncharacterized protein n=1 Tax=Herbiconiux sp. A18JL235 TaxID=3152363 RepID=A0AB39BLE7_9MICO